MSKSSFYSTSGTAQTTELAFNEANDSILAALARAETAAATSEISAETLSGASATVTALINGFSSDLSAAEAASAQALSQQQSLSSVQTAITADVATANAAVATVGDLQADATKLAGFAANTTFTLSTDPNTPLYSALHYATEAASSSTTASQYSTSAQNASSDAGKFASTPVDVAYTLSTQASGYSALHYATKALDAQTATAAIETAVIAARNAATSAAAEASASAVEAQSAASNIAGSHEDFHQKYLGDFTTDPTAGAGGAALAAGDLYYNSSTQVMRIYTTASGWIDQIAASHPAVKSEYIFEVGSTVSHVFSGTDINGRTLLFTENNVDVYVNGVLLRHDEYTENAATNTITIDQTVTLSTGDNILINALRAFSVADVVPKTEGGSFIGEVTFSSATTFSDDVDLIGDLDVEGRLYIETSGTPLVVEKTFSTALINQEHQLHAFKGNNTIIGDLGVQSGDLYIQSRGDSSASKTTGLSFSATAILPRLAGVTASGTVDLGASLKPFNSIYADNIVVGGRSAINDGIPPLVSTNNDLAYESVNNVQQLKMPAITAGDNVSVTKTLSAITVASTDFRLLGLGFYRLAPALYDEDRVLTANIHHAAVINDWEFRQPDYISGATTPISAGFTVPTDRKILIEYGASMGLAHADASSDPYSAQGPRTFMHPLRLRLTCPSALNSSVYEVSSAHGYTQTGDFQQLYGAYLTPASSSHSEFRLEGLWPFDVEGAWSLERIAGQDTNGNSLGPRVAWVRIWDTELT